MNRYTLPLAAAAVAVIWALAGCGGSAPAASPARSAPAHLTAVAACQRLRADMLADGGSPDVPAVRALVAGKPGSAGKDAYHFGLAGDLGHLLADLPDISTQGLVDVSGDVENVADDCLKVNVTLPG